MKKKILLAVTLLSIIIFVSGCGLKQNNLEKKGYSKNESADNETEQEKKIKNNQGELRDVKIDNLSIKLPERWTFKKESGPQNVYVIKSPGYIPLKNNNTTYEGEIYINKIENRNNLSIIDLIDTFDDVSRFWPEKYDYTETNVNGRWSTTFNKIKEGRFSRKNIFVKAENFVYSFSYIYEGGINHEIEGVFDNAVESFNK